jgi:hypothetical protein
MDFNAIIKRVIAILTKPKEEWEVIKNEEMSVSDMYTKYAMILAAIPAVCSFIGWVVVGRSVLTFSWKMPVGTGLILAVFTYIAALAGTYILAFVVDALAPNFGSDKDMNKSLKVTVFAYTASWVGGVFYLIPNLSILAIIAGIYSLVLLFSGLKSLKHPPKEKETGYFVAVIVSAIIIFALIGFVLGAIAASSGPSRLF